MFSGTSSMTRTCGETDTDKWPPSVPAYRQATTRRQQIIGIPVDTFALQHRKTPLRQRCRTPVRPRLRLGAKVGLMPPCHSSYDMAVALWGSRTERHGSVTTSSKSLPGLSQQTLFLFLTWNVMTRNLGGQCYRGNRNDAHAKHPAIQGVDKSKTFRAQSVHAQREIWSKERSGGPKGGAHQRQSHCNLEPHCRHPKGGCTSELAHGVTACGAYAGPYPGISRPRRIGCATDRA